MRISLYLTLKGKDAELNLIVEIFLFRGGFITQGGFLVPTFLFS